MGRVRIVEGSLTFRARTDSGSPKSCTIEDIDMGGEIEVEVQVTKGNKYWVKVQGEKKYVDETEERETF